MNKGRITKKKVEREIKATEKRLKEIERLTGARLSLNKDAIINDPNRKAALESLKNINWERMQEGKKFKKGYVNAVIAGSYYDYKDKYVVNFKTEVQQKDVPRLLTAAAKASKIKGFAEPLNAANVEETIKYLGKYKSVSGWNRHLNAVNRKKADNFADNLQAMIEYGELTNDKDIKAIKHLKALVRKDPTKWVGIIEDHKLYKIAGVNMYDSDEQEVDMKNNAKDILNTVRNELVKEYKDEIEKDTETDIKEVFGKIDPIEYVYLKQKDPAKANEYIEKQLKSSLGKNKE